MTGYIESLKERAILNERILDELNFPSIKRGEGITCQLEGEIGYAVPICLLDFKRPYCGCEGKFQKTSCPYGYTQSGKCRNSEIIKCCIEKCKSALDLVILMDSSNSIGITDFSKSIKFVNDLVSNLEVGFNQTRVGIINFSSTVVIENYFDGINTKKELLDKINSMKYLNGGTFTNRALMDANNQILQVNRGMRPSNEGVPKVVIVITDGVSANLNETLRQAKLIKDRGINMISIGIGNEILTNKNGLIELKGLSSTSGDQYFVKDYNSVLKIINSISIKTCQQPSQTGPEMPISTRVEKDSYKYFKLIIDDDENINETSKYSSTMKMFTIELQQLSGSSELYYSFQDQNPKNQENFIPDSSTPDSDSNFIEKRSIDSHDLPALNAKSSKFYNIDRGQSNSSNVIYFGVNGVDYQNEFQIYVYNRTINNDASKFSVFKYQLILNVIIIFTLSYLI